MCIVLSRMWKTVLQIRVVTVLGHVGTLVNGGVFLDGAKSRIHPCIDLSSTVTGQASHRAETYLTHVASAHGILRPTMSQSRY